MPSPFPGMDPFLENSEYFPDLHDSLVTYLQEMLQPRLPEPYFAKKAKRVWLERADRYIGPDVYIARGRGRAEDVPSGGEVPIATIAETGPIAVAAEPVPMLEVEEPYLQIYTRHDGEKRLVTTIEVLSPSNKSPSSEGRGLYLKKQLEILGSPVHLIEIDLLRGGEHSTAVSRERMLEKTGPIDYHVSLHCFNEPEKFYVYPIRLRYRLPEIAIPLLPEDPAITADLQAVFNRSYDAGPFRREVDYAQETPDPPLSEEQMRWVAEMLSPQRSSGQ